MNPNKPYTNGTAQSERLLNALLPSYAPVDERKLHDLLAMMSELSQHITYYNEKNEPSGSWQPFFHHDIAILLSVINSTNLQEIDSQRIELLKKIESAKSGEESKEAFLKFFKATFQLAQLVNDWYKKSQNINKADNETNLEKELRIAIQTRMAHNLQMLKSYQEGMKQERLMGKKNNFRLDYAQFDPVWEAKAVVQPINIYREGNSIKDKVYEAQKSVRLIHRSFYNSITFITSKVPKLLRDTLENDAFHEPDTGLLISFLQLFEHLQKDMNQLTRKHLEFYYCDVLKQQPKGIIPDQAHIVFKLAEEAEHITLATGARLLTEPDDEGNALHYNLQDNVHIGHAQAIDFKTVFVSKNPLVGVGSSYRLVSGIYSDSTASQPSAHQIKEGEEFAWATFGDEQLNKPEREHTMQDARIGLAICSPILLLSEGERVVDVRFKFELKSLATLVNLISDISKNEKLSPENAFLKIFANSITLRATTPEGWHELTSYEVAPPEDWNRGEIIIRFVLGKSEPALAVYDTEIHGEEFSANWPMLQLLPNPKGGTYIYSFFSNLILENITIDASVKQLSALTVFNDIGQLEANKPFYPFDAIPRVGSYMLIGHEELFKKELTDLEICIDWHNLPQEGFKEYYKAYPQEIDNQSFKVRLSALSEYEFRPAEEVERPVFDLFEAEDAEIRKKNILKSNTKIAPEKLEMLGLQPEFNMEAVDTFDNQTKSGFLKLELSAPQTAFGQELFTELFTDAVTENAKPSNFFGSGAKSKMQVPKEPFVPMIRKLWVNYKASSKITLQKSLERENNPKAKEEVFHLHPFGHERIYHLGKAEAQSVLPFYSDEGQLYLGLENLYPPEQLSVLFQIRQNTQLKNSTKKLPKVRWHYLRDNQWVAFEKAQILTDGTSNFTQSGIITFQIPEDINTNNDLFSNELHWLKASVKEHTDMLGLTIAVYTQAGIVSYTSKPEDNTWQEVLPSESLIEMENVPDQLESLEQPFPSFAGKNSELTEEFYTRISERLRHKSRAVNSWDYERLILDKFPFIHQVKCMGYQNYERFVKRGQVLTVVIPKLKERHILRPKVSYHELSGIEQYLKQLASPFAKVEVINPVYEPVKISCNVMFYDSEEEGRWLSQLYQDIHQYICPWYYDANQELPLGDSISKEGLNTFIEELPYVKYLTRFSAVHVRQESEGYDIEDTASIDSSSSKLVASTPWSVLVPSDYHQIKVIDRQTYHPPEKATIATIGISADFVVGADEPEKAHADNFSLFGNAPEAKEKKRRFFFSIDTKKLS